MHESRFKINTNDPKFYVGLREDEKNRVNCRLNQLNGLGFHFKDSYLSFGYDDILSGLYLEQVWHREEKDWDDYINYAKEHINSNSQKLIFEGLALMVEMHVSYGAKVALVERYEQLAKHGWAFSGDDNYKNNELVDAAIQYLVGPNTKFWPQDWDPKWYKPNNPNYVGNRIDELGIAAGFIAAEIDRLKRLNDKQK